MATFSIKGVKITGISACVPKTVRKNSEHPLISAEDIAKFISTTGVNERRIADDDVCASDLCFKATQALFDRGINKDEVDIVVFLSQSGDYKLPVTSAILQDRLGLSKGCMAIDIPLGCSAFPYGVFVAASMIKASGARKALVMVGDVSTRGISPEDKSSEPLFGDAGSVTVMEPGDESDTIVFDMGTDGSGYKAIIIPEGAGRIPFNANSLDMKESEGGIKRNGTQLVLDGMDVFTFGISQAPQTVNALMNHMGITPDNVDYFIFHQANLFMNEKIRKKLKIVPEKVPYSLSKYGNTSGASIPITMVSEISKRLREEELNVVMCGFGVGLSWGTIHAKLNKIICPEIIEY